MTEIVFVDMRVVGSPRLLGLLEETALPRGVTSLSFLFGDPFLFA